MFIDEDYWDEELQDAYEASCDSAERHDAANDRRALERLERISAVGLEAVLLAEEQEAARAAALLAELDKGAPARRAAYLAEEARRRSARGANQMEILV